ncbi:hypothetical protein Pcac1_g5739 [Phytophthora cactorum]|nr:hypothetical protein Pcac1_g5739 [Phytophthora cactorum]
MARGADQCTGLNSDEDLGICEEPEDEENIDDGSWEVTGQSDVYLTKTLTRSLWRFQTRCGRLQLRTRIVSLRCATVDGSMDVML